jgi:hypothetical protein
MVPPDHVNRPLTVRFEPPPTVPPPSVKLLMVMSIFSARLAVVGVGRAAPVGDGGPVRVGPAAACPGQAGLPVNHGCEGENECGADRQAAQALAEQGAEHGQFLRRTEKLTE